MLLCEWQRRLTGENLLAWSNRRASLRGSSSQKIRQRACTTSVCTSLSLSPSFSLPLYVFLRAGALSVISRADFSSSTRHVHTARRRRTESLFQQREKRGRDLLSCPLRLTRGLCPVEGKCNRLLPLGCRSSGVWVPICTDVSRYSEA